MDLGAPPGARMTPREFIDRQTDRFTQAAVNTGRKAATMASGLAPDTVNQAWPPRRKGGRTCWQKCSAAVRPSDAKSEAPRWSAGPRAPESENSDACTLVSERGELDGGAASGNHVILSPVTRRGKST